MIFNGIRFSFPLVDRAFDWAREDKGSLIAIFLKAGKEKKEGYVFPSDLDEAEDLSTTQEAGDDNAIVIDTNIRRLERRAGDERIHLTTVLLSDPTSEDLSRQCEDCEKIFMARDMEEHGILSVRHPDLRKLLKDIEPKIVMVG